MNRTWSSLSYDEQNKIIYGHYRGESVGNLAKQFGLNESSLDRKIRFLKERNLYNFILKKANASVDPVPVENNRKHSTVQTTNRNPFLKTVDSIYSKNIKSYTKENAFDYVNQDRQPKDRTVFIDSDKEWSGIFFTDVHCPFQDDESVSAMLRVLDVMEYNIIINGGDNLDLYGLSAYAKDPDMLFQNHFQKEVDAHNELMEKIASRAPDVPKLSLYGNHMERYDKWIANTPAISMGYLKNQLSLDNLLRMEYYGWEKFQGTIMFGKSDDIYEPKPLLLLDHGTRVSRGAGKSAASQFNAYGAVSYIMGHVHRLGVAYKRTLHGQHCIAEGGTLRNLSPEYMKYPDWQSGMLHFYVHKDVVTITPIFIRKGIAYVGASKI